MNIEKPFGHDSSENLVSRNGNSDPLTYKWLIQGFLLSQTVQIKDLAKRKGGTGWMVRKLLKAYI